MKNSYKTMTSSELIEKLDDEIIRECRSGGNVYVSVFVKAIARKLFYRRLVASTGNKDIAKSRIEILIEHGTIEMVGEFRISSVYNHSGIKYGTKRINH